jgi:hypothetical protein
MERKVLLALHNPNTLKFVRGICEHEHYEISCAINMQELVNQVKFEDYNRYIMDLNFESPGSSDITSAITFYELVKPQILNGSARFMGISGLDQAVKLALEREIPAVNTLNVGYKFLRDFLTD